MCWPPGNSPSHLLQIFHVGCHFLGGRGLPWEGVVGRDSASLSCFRSSCCCSCFCCWVIEMPETPTPWVAQPRTHKKPRKEQAEDGAGVDPAEVLEADLLQGKIFRLLDVQSLVRCMMVSRSWRAVARADALWNHFCWQVWTGRAHRPLALLESPSLPPHHACLLTLADKKQVNITPREACARTWEMRLKTPCPSYWTQLDPSHKGKPPLKRYFHCDGTITADPGDPIWGGQECLWKIVYNAGTGDGADTVQHVRINRWPLFHISRTQDGRWALDNNFANYSTVPDFHDFKSLAEKEKKCAGCGYSSPSATSSRPRASAAS